MSWGNRIGNAPPNLPYPNFLNINRTQDLSVSLTKVQGRHTIKAGFYLNHAYKAQNLTAGSGGTRFEGELSFANDSNNPFDTGFGFSNALVGAYQRYAQASRFLEGSFLSNNVEGFIQDNWKVNNRLTLDYGLRLVHQQPIYDEFGQGASFFVDRWSSAAAPELYRPGCANNVYPCATAQRRALDPVTGQLLPAGSVSVIGQAVPGSGDPINGLVPVDVAPNNFANYKWPALAVAPRFGAAYDLTGTQSLVLRGGAGLFFDRPRGGTAYAAIGNPPSATSTVRNYGLLGNLASGGLFGSEPVPAITMYEFDNSDHLPSSIQWNGGVQTALPFSLSLDVSYVGQHSYERTGDAGSLTAGLNLNSVDFGTAYRDDMKDPTLPASAVPGATALTTNLLRPFRGLGAINVRAQRYYHTYHSIQISLQRRFRNGISGGFNYTLGLSETSNEDLPIRLDHGPDGSVIERADNAEFQELMKDPGLKRHVLRANVVWDLPDLSPGDGVGRQRLAGIGGVDWRIGRRVYSDLRLSDGRDESQPDGVARLRRTDRRRRRPGLRLFGRSLPDVQHGGVLRSRLRESWPRVGSELSAGMRDERLGHGLQPELQSGRRQDYSDTG
jgi:opacity protein-like surface antigen